MTASTIRGRNKTKALAATALATVGIGAACTMPANAAPAQSTRAVVAAPHATKKAPKIHVKGTGLVGGRQIKEIHSSKPIFVHGKPTHIEIHVGGKAPKHRAPALTVANAKHERVLMPAFQNPGTYPITERVGFHGKWTTVGSYVVKAAPTKAHETAAVTGLTTAHTPAQAGDLVHLAGRHLNRLPTGFLVINGDFGTTVTIAVRVTSTSTSSFVLPTSDVDYAAALWLVDNHDGVAQPIATMKVLGANSTVAKPGQGPGDGGDTGSTSGGSGSGDTGTGGSTGSTGGGGSDDNPGTGGGSGSGGTTSTPSSSAVLTSIEGGSNRPYGSASMIVDGSGFASTDIVMIDGVQAPSFTVQNAGKMTVSLPALSLGAHTISDGSSSLNFQMMNMVAPAITGIEGGDVIGQGTTLLVVNGSFHSYDSFGLDGQPVEPDTSLPGSAIISLPSGYAAGSSHQITVSNVIGTATVNFQVQDNKPTLSAMANGQYASRNGGTVITLTGDNLDGATAVLFGGLPATSFTADSNTQITAVVPADDLAVESTNVIVMTPRGSASIGGLHWDFETYAPIATVSASSNPLTAGSTITLAGQDLQEINGSLTTNGEATPYFQCVGDGSDWITGAPIIVAPGGKTATTTFPEGLAGCDNVQMNVNVSGNWGGMSGGSNQQGFYLGSVAAE